MPTNKLLFFLLLFFFAIILGAIKLQVISNDTSNPITFVSPEYMKSVLNESLFFQRMRKEDLIARHAQSKEDYISVYLSHVQTFTSEQRKTLQKLINDIDRFVSKYPKLHNIEWKFAKVANTIENSYPHTLEDVIVLNDTFFFNTESTQIQTLIHEKLHVYQRLYPSETHELLMNVFGFEFKNKIDGLPYRNNPDINNYVYGKQDYYICQLYNNGEASLANSTPVKVTRNGDLYHTKLSNVVPGLPESVTQTEHPFEIMAVLIPLIILGKVNESHLMKEVVTWMNVYL